jgi:hypothetical protein
MYLDRYLFFLALLKGRGMYVPGHGSVYRKHQGGVNSMVSHIKQVRETLKMHLKIQEHLDEHGMFDGEHGELYRLYRKMLMLDLRSKAYHDFFRYVAALLGRHRNIRRHVLREIRQHRRKPGFAA